MPTHAGNIQAVNEKQSHKLGTLGYAADPNIVKHPAKSLILNRFLTCAD